MKTVCIVQARMGSKRLPGKVLLPLNGHTVIGEVLTRCKKIPGVDEVVCAIPSGDHALALTALEYGRIFCGDEMDVLGRYCEASRAADAEVIVRITGDCPLISPELCGEVLLALKRNKAQYSSNVLPRTFPRGMDCEAFTDTTLRLADRLTFEDREHVTTWMQRSDTVERVNVRSPWPMDGRLTLDTEDDYKVICAAFGHEPYRHILAA